MYVCTEFDVKWHSEDGILCNKCVLGTTTQSRIVDLSLSKYNNYITLIRENERPQLLCVKDKCNSRTIHTIMENDVSVANFKHRTKKSIALGTKKGDIIVYDTKERRSINRLSNICGAMRALEFTYDDRLLCGLDKNTFLVVSNTTKNSNINKYQQDIECTVLKCSPSTPHMATVGHVNGSVALWDVHKCKNYASFKLNNPITGIALSNRNDFLIVSENDVTMYGLDSRSGMTTFEFGLRQEQPVTAIDLETKGNVLAVGLADGTIKLYDMKNHTRPFFSRRLYNSEITKIIFENKNKMLQSKPSSLLGIEEIHSKRTITNSEVFSKSKKKPEPISIRDRNLEKAKNELLYVLKSESDALERQFNDHCRKFQMFLDNELDTINNVIKENWGV